MRTGSGSETRRGGEVMRTGSGSETRRGGEVMRTGPGSRLGLAKNRREHNKQTWTLYKNPPPQGNISVQFQFTSFIPGEI